MSATKQVKSKKRVTDHGEVFTADREVVAMLDLVEPETKNITARFLEPACGTGNFLVEILQRKLAVVKSRYAANQKEFEQQTTAAVSSICGVDILPDNVAECRHRLFTLVDEIYTSLYSNRCTNSFRNSLRKILQKNILCGDSLALQTPALKQLFHSAPFDVVVGNPPYQLSDSGAQASAMPLYHKFIDQAKKLHPKYLTMIVPSRWFAGGKGLDAFRKEMLTDNRLRVLHDYIDANECFPGRLIKGGVCYFLWDRDNPGLCKVVTHEDGKIISEKERPLLEKNTAVFIRYNEAVPILHKILKKKEASFSTIVSVRKPFGLPTNFKDYKKNFFTNSIKLYANQTIGYVRPEQLIRNRQWVKQYKIYIPEAIGIGNSKKDRLLPILGEPNTCCTETYLVIGPFSTKKEAENAMSYIQTKFFHFLLSLKKITQHTTNKVYFFIPLQSFEEAWKDEQLYEKYALTKKEIAFIESMVRPIDTGKQA